MSVSVWRLGFALIRSVVKGFEAIMDKRGGVTETENGDAFLELNRIAMKYPHRYTKVRSLHFPLKVVCGAAGHRSGWQRFCGRAAVKAEKPLPGLGFAGWYKTSNLLNVM